MDVTPSCAPMDVHPIIVNPSDLGNVATSRTPMELTAPWVGFGAHAAPSMSRLCRINALGRNIWYARHEMLPMELGVEWLVDARIVTASVLVGGPCSLVKQLVVSWRVAFER